MTLFICKCGARYHATTTLTLDSEINQPARRGRGRPRLTPLEKGVRVLAKLEALNSARDEKQEQDRLTFLQVLVNTMRARGSSAESLTALGGILAGLPYGDGFLPVTKEAIQHRLSKYLREPAILPDGTTVKLLRTGTKDKPRNQVSLTKPDTLSRDSGTHSQSDPLQEAA